MVRELVSSFIASNFYVADGALADDASLLDAGVVDSTGVLEIIDFLEHRFGIHVEDHEAVRENLDSVAALTAFIGRRLAAGNGTALLLKG